MIPRQSQKPMKIVNSKSPNSQSLALDMDQSLPPNLEHSEIYGFQKNYPKNIFIPMIEYLSEAGYQEKYEECVGSRQMFEAKNVVSLGAIHKLLGQNWFINSINKQDLSTNVGNKILFNSKIKKKVFHIKIFQFIMRVSHLEFQEFRNLVSKQSYNISSTKSNILLTDELFNYSNASIYLLYLFLDTLIDNISLVSLHKLLSEQRSKPETFAQQAQPDNLREYYKIWYRSLITKSSNKGSKEQYKIIAKQIVNIFSKDYIAFDSIDTSIKECSKKITDRMSEIRQKFKFQALVPHWDPFIDCVVFKCFYRKSNFSKVTNSALNQWINQFKKKAINALNDFQRNPTVIKSQQQKIKKSEKWYGAKSFKPIILSLVSDDEYSKNGKSSQLP